LSNLHTAFFICYLEETEGKMRYTLVFVLFISLISCSSDGVNQLSKDSHTNTANLKWQQLTLAQAATPTSEEIEHFFQYLESEGRNWRDLVSNGKVFVSVQRTNDINISLQDIYPLQDISPLWEGTWISYHTHLELSDTFPILCGDSGIANMYHSWKYLSRHDAPGCFDDKGHVLNRCLYTLSNRFYVVCSQ